MFSLGDLDEPLEELAVSSVDVELSLLLKELKGPHLVVMSLLQGVLHLLRLLLLFTDHVLLDVIELLQVDIHASKLGR